MQLATAPKHDWPAAPIATARRDATRVQLGWADGDTQSLPLIWLRDNCLCAECRIASTGEHRYFLGRVKSKPDATGIAINRGEVSITWSDGHCTRFTNDDLATLLHIADRHHVQARVWTDAFEHNDFLAMTS